MRSVQRYARTIRSEWLNRFRKEEVRKDIQSFLGESVTFGLSGSRGADSIFEVKNTREEKIGVLRLLNPYRKIKTTIDGAPYIILDGPSRIARELETYEKGSKFGLTPRVLWSDRDALLCEYFDGYSGFELYQNNKLGAVQLIDLGWKTLKAAHDADLTHMDASIQNILVSSDLKSVKLVDFEFGAADHMTFENRCLYDFLRYLESSLKFLDPISRQSIVEYVLGVKFFDAFSQDNHNVEKLKPALKRLTSDHALWSALQNKMGINK